mmetsp:Transcript_28096/g.77275  ORF Transcript_28096/g.77275 Transcript_28096/m.77275 type:complete len:170 (-) Transcript_28096:34-543(-)
MSDKGKANQPINKLTTRLMPVSQAVCWYSIVNSQKAEDPTTAAFDFVKLASAFFCAWALYNKFLGGMPKELGHISMGLTCAAATFRSKKATVAGIGVVLLNFFLPIVAFNVILMPARKLALMAKKNQTTDGIVWAWVFKGYMISSCFLWGYTMYVVLTTVSEDDAVSTE